VLPRSQLSNNRALSAVTKEQLNRIEKGEWYHSIELPDGQVIRGIIPVEALRSRLNNLGLPLDLRGKRVLDVGAATGWCSFEMERRGAKVVAVDCVEYEDFRVAHRLLGSEVDYKVLDVEELNVGELGQFDIVLFLGVLYHLRHPLLGLEKLLPLARESVLVESFVCDAQLDENERGANGCYMEFYETDQLGGQIDNWVGPNVNCLLALCRAAGYVRVELAYVQDHRAGISCQRRWENCPALPTRPSPVIGSAVNNRTGDNIFHKGKDEYLCLYFRSSVEALCAGDLRVEIDGLGVPILTLTSHTGERWQANLRIPFGIETGAHAIRLRLVDSLFSESLQFYFGVRPPVKPKSPVPAGLKPVLYRASNGLLDSNEFYGYRSDYLCCCFYLETQQLDREDVIVEVDSHQLVPSFVGSGEGWQANVKLPANLEANIYSVRVRVRNGESSNELTIVVRT
jgi:tRNA (mo5U34)-methyltransferase